MQGVSSRPSNSAETTTTDLCVMRKEGERGNEKGEYIFEKRDLFSFFGRCWEVEIEKETRYKKTFHHPPACLPL
jgi:hypothetical protein